jgi:hypothetical protein
MTPPFVQITDPVATETKVPAINPPAPGGDIEHGHYIVHTLECVERVVLATDEGTEIIRTFFLDPYESHPWLISVLLGAVTPDPNDNTKWVRRLPAHDSYVPECYCTEARVVATHSDAMAGSPPIGKGVIGGGHSVQDGLDAVQGTLNKESPRGHVRIVEPYRDVSDAGCFVRAVFRPIIYEKVLQGTPFKFTPSPFDFVDPLKLPLPKTVSCGMQLKYTLGKILNANVGTEGFVTQPFEQFTIRRLMVGKVPENTIAKLAGKINVNTFTIGNLSFPPETLRFDNCEVVKRAVPYIDGSLNVWYDLLYVFTQNLIFDEYWDTAGNDYGGPQYVGWNCILGCPLMPVLGLPIALSTARGFIKSVPLSYYPVGWKSQVFNTDSYRPLYLYDTDSKAGTANGFADLFDPAST